jgi:hypothetical protein
MIDALNRNQPLFEFLRNYTTIEYALLEDFMLFEA